MRPAPQRPGESAADFKARVKAAEEKWKARNQAVRSASGGPKVPGSNYSGTRGMSSADPGSGGGRPRNMGPGSGLAPVAGGRGIVKGLPTPKKSAPREKVVLRDANGQRIKDRKPVLYSGSGMKSGGMVKGKK
jgi:hypothetical protein